MPLPAGVRVRVPLGRDVRVGFVVGVPAASPVENVRSLCDIIDSIPALPRELWETAEWFGKTWFIGLGMALKNILPAKFLAGELLEPLSVEAIGTYEEARTEYVYMPEDKARYEAYKDILKTSPVGVLMLFPEISCAKNFWGMLSPTLRKRGALSPEGSAAKQWELWKRARSGDVDFIVGAKRAAFMPLRGFSKVIIDDEKSRGWLTQRHPIVHVRSLAAKRADIAGASLVLGGRMPSSKVFMHAAPKIKEQKCGDRIIFVDIHNSYISKIPGMKEDIPISLPLIRSSAECIQNREWVFWILDRKGYAGEIYCDECGSAIRCEKCGGAVRWLESGKTLECMNCAHKKPLPDVCPHCGGSLLAGRRPGLEALCEVAKVLLGDIASSVILVGDGCHPPSAESLKHDNPEGALLLGTRRILSYTDVLSPSLIGWIDSDAEARGNEYNAKTRAFELIWESAWRGSEPDKRKIIVQSMRPSRGWQVSLKSGSSRFWRCELAERRKWGLPPYIPMIKIVMPKGGGAVLSAALERSSFVFWESEENPDEIWVKTKQFALLSELLAPHFEIKEHKKVYPKVELYLE